MTDLGGFAIGVLGGIAAETLKWHNLKDGLQEKGIPESSKSFWYWLITVVMIALGGALVVIYMNSGAIFTPIVALHIGASTPLLLAGITREIPTLPPTD